MVPMAFKPCKARAPETGSVEGILVGQVGQPIIAIGVGGEVGRAGLRDPLDGRGDGRNLSLPPFSERDEIGRTLAGQRR